MKRPFCCGQNIFVKKVSPKISAPLHLILKPPKLAEHEWRSSSPRGNRRNKHRICQICHLHLDSSVLRCHSCHLTAHSHCSTYSSSSSRVQDNSLSTSRLRHHDNRQLDNNQHLFPHFQPRIKKIESPFSSSDSIAASTALIGTVSITERSDSKTPEIHITPSEVGGVRGEARLSSEIIHDSGCTGLIDDSDHSFSPHPGGHSLPPTRSSNPPIDLQHLEGPIDGSPYAIVLTPKTNQNFNPVATSSPISSVSEMKDLDKLIDALVEQASSLDDQRPFPYDNHNKHENNEVTRGYQSSQGISRSISHHQPSQVWHHNGRRSHSAEGRNQNSTTEGDDGSADEWLARQMKKLNEKRASKHTPREDWLAELKRALPAHPLERSESSVSQSVGSRHGNISYSSDEEEDVEILQAGRRGRQFSEQTSSSTTRAPSQLSYTGEYREIPFPICPPTPYTNRPPSPIKPPRSPKQLRRYQGATSAPISSVEERATTPVNPRPILMIESEVKFATDLTEFWYKPHATREETVAALLQAPAGSFVIRNSNSFPGAYGLAIKVNHEIRHFLIEPTRFGVRLRGCGTSEPVFSSLSALVYAHSIECLALPTTLTLPVYDILPSSHSQSQTHMMLRQGAACQLLFLGMVGVECLGGEEAINKGLLLISAASPVPISLRLSKTGLTLTDVFRKQFFRIHFGLDEISYASVVGGRSVAYGREVKQVFGVVARAPRARENSVILLAELEAGQPANAIVSFIQRVVAWQHT